ncbi:MAG: 2-iminoacetate synthase ThiH [Phycisphaerae bacterium]|jgi:2-iminoacetate synthase
MDIQKAIHDDTGYSPERLEALMSPESQNYLEQMAQKARQITRQRFGNTIQLYAPLYVSNFCVNSCPYCAFNAKSNLPRKRLSVEQACKEADILANEGFRHILIVSGEDTKFVTIPYLVELSKKLREKFSSIAIEIYPASTEDYEKLFATGVESIAIYQETYDRTDYAKFHKTGPKSDYDWRLDTLSRAAAAGFRSLGLGFLIGLSDWRTQTVALAEHANFLMKKYWQARVSFSFPRMRPAENVDEKLFKHMISDTELVQIMISLRLCFPDSEIVMSTRESPRFRDNMAQICVTRMSAGSKTNPGGYAEEDASLKQFEIADDRTPRQVSSMLKSNGLEAVWKDWDAAFIGKD